MQEEPKVPDDPSLKEPESSTKQQPNELKDNIPADVNSATEQPRSEPLPKAASHYSISEVKQSISKQASTSDLKKVVSRQQSVSEIKGVGSRRASVSEVRVEQKPGMGSRRASTNLTDLASQMAGKAQSRKASVDARKPVNDIAAGKTSITNSKVQGSSSVDAAATNSPSQRKSIVSSQVNDTQEAAVDAQELVRVLSEVVPLSEGAAQQIVDDKKATLATPASQPKKAKAPKDKVAEAKTTEQVEECLRYVKNLIALPQLESSMWQPEHENELKMFLNGSGAKKLTIFVMKTEENHTPILCIQQTLPSSAVEKLMYFIRDYADESVPITMSDFSIRVQYGVVSENVLESLLRLMNGVYVPLFLENHEWPDSVKKEFAGQLHKFMAYLTDSTFQLKGHTVLYVPHEDLSKAEEISKDKDVVQRLESLLIHWTRQIKEVVNNQHNNESAETVGPLEEIEFWKSRCVDLSGISTQLTRPEVTNILKVLTLSKSSYLDQFMRLSTLIQDGSNQARDNLRYLSSLIDPCKELAASDLKKIPSLLQRILHCIRIIWANSKYYNTRERMTSLLRKVSNEIINRCISKISLENIFHGDIHNATGVLNESIQCGEAWKNVYKRNVGLVSKFAKGEWDFDQSSIFAQIDAFVQRCRDLLEVCEGQMQFARKLAGGSKSVIPIFTGTKGPEIAKSIEDIEKAFEKQLNILWENRKFILDVKATKWHDDYHFFKQGIKDLEVMMQTVIHAAFESSTSVESGINLLNTFNGLAKRDAIRRALEKKAREVFQSLLNEILAVKNEFETRKKSPELLRFHPDFAGSAIWARSLLRRVQSGIQALKSLESPQLPLAEEAKAVYEALSSSIDDYVTKCHLEWISSIPPDISSKLDTSLMERRANNFLEMKFDKDLIRLFNEIYYWQKLKCDIPFTVQEMYSKKEELRILRDSVYLVVRDYNTILETLTPEEHLLFKERIHFLDRKIHPGLSNLTWSSKGITEHFVKECRKNSHDVQKIVAEFMESSAKIQKCCENMSNVCLWAIENKKVYELSEFEECQRLQRENAVKLLLEEHTVIRQTIQAGYEVFKADGKEVYEQWVNFVGKVDGWVAEALHQMVKKALTDISSALNGEGKSRDVPSEIQPLFKVEVVLKASKVEFSPSLQKLDDVVNRFSRAVISSIEAIARLKQSMTESQETAPPISVVIGKDEDILKLLVNIQNGLTNNAQKCEAYLHNWDSYREIWEINKDAFIRRYAKLKPAMSTFEADINRYTEVANNTQKEETLTNINFVRLDCSPLKHALVAHCNQWQNKLTTLLNNNASNELSNLHKMFIANSEKLRRNPGDLDQLSESMNLLAQLRVDSTSIESQFGPIQEMYQILEKYDVNVKDEEKKMLESLPSTWGAFQQMMNESDRTLRDHKSKFKADLLASLDEFTKNVSSLKDEFFLNGPFAGSSRVENAFALIEEYRVKIHNSASQERSLHKGLTVFKIEQPSSKDIELMTNSIDHLSQIWALSKEYSESWEKWKVQLFNDLDVSAIEEASQGYQKRLQKLGKDIKDWDVWQTLRDKLFLLKKIIPLLRDLKNEALRDRHWLRMNELTSKQFSPNDSDFTLEKIADNGLDQHAEHISNVSESATKELFIEHGIAAIKKSWSELFLDIVSFKQDKGYYKLRSTDTITELLEDNQVTLSGMKLSKFFKPFEKEVDHWERTLSRIMEIIELLLQVQRQWFYLENIFVGSEDIRKQLPKESSVFDDINTSWKGIMDRMMVDRNVLRATHEPDLHNRLKNMNGQMEKIQKSLDMYLETKRQSFPRFYFLSNEDLLEILGQTKDPSSVQPHLRKCFDNIHHLELAVIGAVGRKQHYEATGMHSADGEFVPFATPVVVEGSVESWLWDVETSMRDTLKKQLLACITAQRKVKRDKWLKDFPGQLLITAGQIAWTVDCTRALVDIEKGEKGAMKELKRKQVSNLKKLAELVKTSLTKVERKKLVALITTEVHSRDVIDKMAKSECSDVNAFEWLSQLRFYWDKEVDDCIVKQTNASFTYGYEYLGNSGRLVITPLTDRCFMTLTAALRLNRGGCPQGRAGSGKTESVKDLGKALGVFVLVVNCSEALDYKSMGRMFSGLAQTGTWSCFDEFNRIDIEVLSVVALQISTILAAVSRRAKTFVFENKEIKLKSSCAVFVTMNPSYLGRTELPDNVKSLFRPVAMMIPDSAYIAEIVLFAEGFSNTKILSKKVESLFRLSSQQLSKQSHYDFGLRSLTSSLKTAGNRKRQDINANDDVILFLSLKDSNIPKLTTEDVPLFMGILHDLFPGIEFNPPDLTELVNAVVEEMKSSKLQPESNLIDKIIQLYETKLIRHGVMCIGTSSSGKSTIWKTLQGALTSLSKNFPEKYVPVKTFPINPKAMSLGALYGQLNSVTGEWVDGVLSSIMRSVCLDDKKDQKWIVIDGPVETSYIESMNTVLDDNKILTLSNGDRIALPEQVSLVFEADNLEHASPATVSRCGMIFCDYQSLGWKPFISSWLETKHSDKDIVARLVEKYMPSILEFKRKSCEEIVPVDELTAVRSFCNLFDSLATRENGVDPSEADFYARMVEMWFLFCMIWSLGAALTDESRHNFDMFLREIEGQFPSKDTVYEYFIDVEKRKWVSWEEKLSPGWRYAPNTPFHKILVPTIDTARYDYLIRALRNSRNPVLLVGELGIGKSSIVHNVLQNFEEGSIGIAINMSAQTSSERIQTILESKMEKRTKNVYVPSGGKTLTVFIDDLNMPRKDKYGCQTPLELIKHWMDYGFVYDLQKQTIKYLHDVILISAMGKPGGGRNSLSPRFQSRFNALNLTAPTESTLFKIYGTIINVKFQDFEEDVKPLGDILTRATIDIYNSVIVNLLPTRAKMHYLFSLRDISKVYQGLLRASRDFYDSKEAITKLWLHEMYRVFHDRLVDNNDRDWFYHTVDEKLSTHLATTVKQLCGGERHIPLFGDFMRPDLSESRVVYQEIEDLSGLRSFLEQKLTELNSEPGAVQMNLVLFRDVMEHLVRITRILTLPFGHALLVGMGGSGRKSLCRLAAFIVGAKVFQIEATKNYKTENFREDIKEIFKLCGLEKQKVVFMFSDTQIVNESFLEDVSNILSTGEVANLFTPEEMGEIRNSLAPEMASAKLPDTLDAAYALFIQRTRNYLHVILCMSPVSEAYRNRLRMFPSLINCTTIDWFNEWPEDALLEVGIKLLDSANLGLDSIKNIAQIFVTIHTSVLSQSQAMSQELNRKNYVTPINYLELVKGYAGMLTRKRLEIGNEASKLRGGLSKLDDTRKSVEKISVELDHAKKQVAQYQKQCEDYLVIIVQQKREADDQARAVAARSEKLSTEEEEVRGVATAAQADLDLALPALNAATKALEALNKKDLQEVKSYGKPPALVEKVMEAVMVLRKCEPTWDESKRQLGNPNFIKQLVNFDKDNISDKILKKISQYCSDENFNPEIIGRVSSAAKSLCLWVRAMETYGNIYRQVAPKREKLRLAQTNLEKKQESLKEAKDKLQEIQTKIEELKNQYDEKVALKEKLRREAEETEQKLKRAEQLVAGLSGEKTRWEKSIERYEECIRCLPGDCLVGAAFVSYLGPFNSTYRTKLVQNTWITQIKSLEIPLSEDFSFVNFLGKSTEMREWNLQGLPRDTFSCENGILATNGMRWPLMIDPQGQANKWIKNFKKGVKIVESNNNDIFKVIEQCIISGSSVLVQNIGENIDAALDPVLKRAVSKNGDSLTLRLGDKIVDYNPSFQLYFTTKLSNPHYSPEIAATVAIINFAVKESGLEDQLLGIVVRKEKPDLEEQKDSLVINVAGAKKRLLELEDEILILLSTAQGSILDDEKLVNALQSSKSTAEEVIRQLKVSEQTESKIDSAREIYRPCAQRASVLFFVLNELVGIDPMYQFSLDNYISLFEKSIAKSNRSDDLGERIIALNDYHTFAVYKNTCRGLFGRHKLLFSFQMATKILEGVGKLNKEEYDFFLRGGHVIDRESQMPNPCGDWIKEEAWDNVTELSRLPGFTALISSLEQNEREWKSWFMTAEPEETPLPGEWDSKLTDLERILILRSLRPDRIVMCAQKFIINNLGQKYIDPPVFDIEEIYADSSNKTPLVFILSPGVDPTSTIYALAEQKKMGEKFNHLSLGQGQTPRAMRFIQEGMRSGYWVFLANCHLSISWMPVLEKLIEQMSFQETHPDFRLWLSSSPHPDFPIAILQASLKLTTEPPIGLRANLLRLYNMISETKYNECSKRKIYHRLLFSLCFFHSILIERKKFLGLGFNVRYDFNDSDFDVCQNLLCNLLDEYLVLPWDALRYLIAEANYGGRVTDEWDRRILKSYINQYFCEEATTTEHFKLSSMPVYYIPEEGDLTSVKEYCATLPGLDRPEAFGQHPNADIASQIRSSTELLSTLLSLQPRVVGGPTHSREEKVLAIAAEIARQIPEKLDEVQAQKYIKSDPTPVNVVLLQEIRRYNSLLDIIRISLNDLFRGIKGLVVMTSELEDIYNAISEARVPSSWSKTYPSLKPLGAWTRDLLQRIEFFSEWSKGNEPRVFWLSAFTFPSGFLTAVLQRSARKNSVPIDMLAWETVVQQTDDEIATPKEGVLVQGIYLEGASWDRKLNCLREPKSMELVTLMPIIHFKPIESKKKQPKGYYTCPMYYYPVRTGSEERPSFVIALDLKAGQLDSNFFVKRGTALLLSLA